MGDEAVVAHLLWQMKVIATKEVERLPLHTLESFLIDPPNTECNSQKFEEEFRSNVRGRTVSVGSYDCAPKNSSLDTLAVHNTSTSEDSSSTDLISLEHNDWSKQEGFRSKPRAARKKILITKHGKRKTESYIGLTTKSGFVRATLRRKFSWKQYPELENFLIANQEMYFEYSSRNYTSEQRKYNNSLTRELLDLAAGEGYIFEDFTFAMVRDRIRCYFKSYSQSMKKRRKK